MKLHSTTDIGRRDDNQDNFFVADFKEISKVSSTWVSDSIVAMCVCDGMGGQAAGRFFSWYVSSELYNLDLGGSYEDIAHSMYRIHKEAVNLNQVFIRQGKVPTIEGFTWDMSDTTKMDGKDGGTTVSLAIVDGEDGSLTCYNVGDSRVYVISNTGLRQITVDDSADKLITSRDGTKVKKSSKLTRCVGINTEYNGSTGTWADVVTVTKAVLRPEDIAVLVCSDGFCNRFDPDTFCDLLSTTDVDTALQETLDYVYSRGEKDNATAVVLDLRN